jgi:hypothetical protein
MLRAFLLAAALALLATGCFGGGDDGGSSVSAGDGESLVLQQEDVDSERFDRQGGWKARFSRIGTPRTEGALVVSSLADLFGSDDDAAEDFELYKASLDQFTTSGGREVPVSGLGDDAHAVTFTQGLKPNVIHHYAIAWRDGPVTASVTANGFRLTWPQALALARAQEARIRAAAD